MTRPETQITHTRGGARDCLPPRVQANVQSMASDGNGCRDLRICEDLRIYSGFPSVNQSSHFAGITNGKENYRVVPRRDLEVIGAVGANLWPFSFGGSVGLLPWSAHPW